MSLKEGILSAAGRVLATSFPGAGIRKACDRLSVSRGVRLAGGPKFQILVYHRVLPEKDPFSIGVVSEREMRGQMAILRKCFRPVPLAQLMEELDRGGPEPGTVCVTFDDGYLDNHRYALPILEEFGIPATVYLATDFIGTGKVPWYDRVLQAVKASPARRLDPGIEGFPPMDLPSGEAARADAAHRVTRWLKRFGPGERDGHIDRILAALAGPGAAGTGGPAELMLGWDEARDMARRGVVFGAHTMTHPILTRVPPAEAEAEIAGSKRLIEEKLQAPVTLFAYPNGQAGDWDRTLMDILRKQGFACAVTTVEGVNTPGRDRMELFRRQPWESDPHSFLFRMCSERVSA